MLKYVVNPKFCIQQNYASGMKVWKKTFSDEKKLREFVTSRSVLKETLKEDLQTEGNYMSRKHERAEMKEDQQKW